SVLDARMATRAVFGGWALTAPPTSDVAAPASDVTRKRRRSMPGWWGRRRVGSSVARGVSLGPWSSWPPLCTRTPRLTARLGGSGRMDGQAGQQPSSAALVASCRSAGRRSGRWRRLSDWRMSRKRYARPWASARLGGMRALRVLVADDQEHMRELMVEALSADGHTVDPAEDGMAALKLLETQTYDLVVSDLQMPQVDGPKLYQEIRRRKPDAAPF